MRLARCSKGIGFGMAEPYECSFDWPENCFVQCGEAGIVFAVTGNYETAYFEAFPRDPNHFLRGEGKTVEDAEADCWKQYQRILACAGHEFERRSYKNGLGFCKHCGLASKVFEPAEHCVVCGVATYYTSDTDGNWYCKEHKDEIPEEKKTELAKMMAAAVASLKEAEPNV